MSKPFFTAEDFINISPNQYTDVADIANAKLEKALGPVVYGRPHAYSWSIMEDGMTEKARLFMIEKIVRECVEHEPKFGSPNDMKENECEHCGKKLKAKWEVAE